MKKNSDNLLILFFSVIFRNDLPIVLSFVLWILFLYNFSWYVALLFY